VDGIKPKPRSAHVIVLGNEKGGSGKSTVAVHVIVALLKAGRRVASIDTDSRQLSLTRYLENRARWSRKNDLALELPVHFSVKPGAGETITDIEADEFAAFKAIVERLGQTFDFVVIDTPANDSYRMRLSHAIADTLITPVNDSFVDLDVLGRVDPENLSVLATSQYAELVRGARRERHLGDSGETDWIVLRNRLSTLASRNQAKVVRGLKELSALLEFRIADGVSERVIFREFFPMGLTALDQLDRTTLGVQPTMSHLAARREVSELIAFLNLPVLEPAVDDGAPPIAVAASAG
jgi:chromosome partitioning protein